MWGCRVDDGVRTGSPRTSEGSGFPEAPERERERARRGRVTRDVAEQVAVKARGLEIIRRSKLNAERLIIIMQ